ncbi:hypothetical protein J2741_000258 [Methanolinea mesophila]|uniref:hypothetical protein n=1 Tax=Methanolinea mesophila TaxID=547055 RepID=UPI001AE3D37E|nr:hypothetical protein [Methanolinea mesophila]MBP1927711.1 hypothetical protein [Methanolinea mesophila]
MVKRKGKWWGRCGTGGEDRGGENDGISKKIFLLILAIFSARYLFIPLGEMTICGRKSS